MLDYLFNIHMRTIKAWPDEWLHRWQILLHNTVTAGATLIYLLKTCRKTFVHMHSLILIWKDIIYTVLRQNLHCSCYATSVLYFILYVHFLGCSKTSPHLLQFLRKMLQSCFAVQLQKCFVDDKTSPSLSSARGWVDNGWIFISGWTFPLRVCNLFVIPYFNHLIEHGTII